MDELLVGCLRGALAGDPPLHAAGHPCLLSLAAHRHHHHGAPAVAVEVTACDAAPAAPTNDDDDDDESSLVVAARSTSAFARREAAVWGRRRVAYAQLARQVGPGADVHMLRLLMDACATRGAFVHPALALARRATQYRDHGLVAHAPLPRLTPLLAVPEALCLGYKDASDRTDVSALGFGSYHSPADAAASTGADRLAAGSTATTADDDSGSDIVSFFFTSLGLLVNDLLVARNNPRTDPRYVLARSLQHTRTLQNGPYLEPGAFDADDWWAEELSASDTDSARDDDDANSRDDGDGKGKRSSRRAGHNLVAVCHQMLHNYIHSGPLTGKVDIDELKWAVSVALSHSTPLRIGPRHGIGVVPLLHLLPHGERNLNAVCVTRPATERSASAVQDWWGAQFPWLALRRDCGYVTVVAARDIAPGEEIALQPMAPACGVEGRAMWGLACGAPPPGSAVSSVAYQRLQAAVDAEVLSLALAARDAPVPPLSTDPAVPPARLAS